MVFFKRESLIRAGGYNEYFRSWGHEDRELLHRMSLLGYRMKNVDGHMHHMRHPRLQDSHPHKNPYYKKNLEEYEKVQAMDREEVLQYIAGFSWAPGLKDQ